MSEQKIKYEIKPGAKIGRWTVTDKYTKTPKGERKWYCRCECGTEKYVLERSLRHGGTLSCGCLRKEKLQETNNDLTGQIFGELRVLGKAENQRKNGGVWWSCRCSCGKTVDYPATLLVTGKRTSCGCKTVRNKDISNQVFDSLTALYPTDKRDKKGNVIWHCVCNNCGRELDVSYNQLLYTNRKSCGCRRKRNDEKLPEFLTHIAGTSIDMLRSDKIPKNNSTGYKGVYYINGRYTAKIVFQKKAYYLGNYDKIEDAVSARKKAETIINDGTLNHYNRWKAKADADPEWGEENPIKIIINQLPNKELEIIFLPEIPD